MMRLFLAHFALLTGCLLSSSSAVAAAPSGALLKEKQMDTTRLTVLPTSHHPLRRELRTKDDNAAFVAEYHNMVVAALVKNDNLPNSSSTLTLMDFIAEVLQADKEFPAFSAEEMVSLVQEMIPLDTNFEDFDGVVLQVLQNRAAADDSKDPVVMKALLAIMTSLDQVESVDEMVHCINEAAAAAASKGDAAEMAAIFEAVAHASESFWTDYFVQNEKSAHDNDGRALCRKGVAIGFMDAFGALMGVGGGLIGSLWVGALFSIVTAIVLSNE